MKKRWIVMGLAVAFAAVVLAMNMGRNDVVTVEGVTLAPRQVEQTVSCMGVVEAADGTAVFAPMSCQIGRVSVKAGQRVNKGDVLATIDLEATRQSLIDPSQQVVLAGMRDAFAAPIDGIVVSVNALAGETLEAGTPCAVIAGDNDVRVRIGIREKDLKQLKKGMQVRVKGEGFLKEVYEGELTEISSAALTEAENGTVVEGVVRLRDGEVDSSLRLGLTAKASVITSVTEDGFVIPYEAVLSDEQGDYVYVFDNDKVCMKRVSPVYQAPDGVVLTDSEWHGVTVILCPDEVTEGQTVKITEEKQ